MGRGVSEVRRSAQWDESSRLVTSQEGVDASLYIPTQAGTASAASAASATSTQSAKGDGPNWDDLSQIPSNQGTGAGASASVGGRDGDAGSIVEKGEKSKNSLLGLAPMGEDTAGDDDASDGSNTRDGDYGTTDGKVSDPTSSNALSLAAPIRTTPQGPHKGAQGGGIGDGVVDVGVNDIGVAGQGGVGGVDVDVTAKKITRLSSGANNTTTSSEWRPRVCNQVWRGGTCKNRSKGCRFAHPTPCNSNNCATTPAPNCRAFHPKRKGGNDRGDARKGNAAPKSRRGLNGSHRPSGSSNSRGGCSGGGSSGSRSGSNSTNNKTSGARGSGSSSSTNNRSALNLGDRMARVERHLAGMSGNPPSYRDVAVRGLSGGNNGGSSSITSSNKGDFGLAQPNPAMLSTVVAAVMAVLSGRGPHY